jgi:hypothetical protein
MYIPMEVKGVDEDLWDIQRLAKALGVSEGAVRMRIRRGEIPESDFLILRKKYWSKETIEKWLETNRVKRGKSNG